MSRDMTQLILVVLVVAMVAFLAGVHHGMQVGRQRQRRGVVRSEWPESPIQKRGGYQPWAAGPPPTTPPPKPGRP